MLISVSDIASFLRCRRRWDWGSPVRGNLTALRSAKALWMGEAIHAALEAKYNGGADPVAALTEWCTTSLREMTASGVQLDPADQESYDEAFALATAMLLHYEQYYANDDITVVLAEQEFKVPIPGTVDGYLVGRMDGICRDSAGRVWVLEHKTYAQFPGEDYLLMNRQMTAYAWAANILTTHGTPSIDGAGLRNARIHGALYNGLRKSIPEYPQVLQSGKLSIARGQNTTYEMYVEMLRAKGLPESEYEPILTHLRQKGNTFFKREYVRRTGFEFADLEHWLAQVHNEMANPAIQIYPSPMMDCSWSCEFKAPCMDAMQGADEQYSLKVNYIQRPPRGVVYVESEEL